MTNKCSEYTELIDRSRFEELDATERFLLEEHLGSCDACSQEVVRLDQAITALHELEEVPVPRHFFVETHSSGLAGWLREYFSTPWKLGLTGATAMLLIAVTLVVSQVQVQAHEGAMTIGFGNVAARSDARMEEIRSELVELVGREVAARQAALLHEVRLELRKSSEDLEQRQTLLVNDAINRFRLVIDDEVAASEEELEAKLIESAGQVYRDIVRQVSADVTYLNDRLDLLAVRGEIESNKSDALVETLLKIADTRER